MGFVDLHLHLLPQIDDGARSMEDALQMARVLVANGFTAAAPSPHNRSEYAPREVCLQRLDEVRAALRAASISLELHVNSENQFVDEKLFESARPLAGGPYALIEAPYTTPLPVLPDVIFRLKLKGVTPLIAHPERCLEFERKGRAAEAVRGGALLQLDIAALVGRYGPQAKKLARTFLDQGLYAVAASDMHSPVGADKWLAESIAALEKAVGAPAVQALLATTPAALLRGEMK
ncbi:MAG: protein tyrosine phosphatase [Archangiaceae bacterium]|nr:protein tyrosine phosphatase [Archangiaceae bacterium]